MYGILTYIYRKNQLNVAKNIPYLDPTGYNGILQEFTLSWLCILDIFLGDDWTWLGNQRIIIYSPKHFQNIKGTVFHRNM